MAPRVKLQALLEQVLNSRNVYFQPPETVRMKYPCIVYDLADIHVTHADNAAYLMRRRYALTVIDKNPDSDIPDKLLQLPLCSFERFYTADNLNHYALTIYF